MRTPKSIVAMAFVTMAVACGLVLAGCGASQASSQASRPPAGAAAYFGDQVITEDEVTAYTQSFREANGLTDNTQWKDYLTLSGMTVETWREQVIRQKADRLLIEQKASELGITPDETAVDERIAAMRAQAGIAADDEEAWKTYLAGSGQTPEGLRDSLEFSSVEQQVFKSQINLTTEMREEMCDSYIAANLADQVVRRYAAIEFALDEESQARACFDQLSGLAGDELTARFGELCAQRASELAAAGNTSLSAGDKGWDFLFRDYAIDPDRALRRAQLEPGQLYPDVLKGTDAYRVVLCDERVSFADNPTYSSLSSDSLKATLIDATLSMQWASLFAQYIADLEQEANVQVVVMPSGLPYDVTD